ncbi:MAG TPA: RidA family protein [Rhabdochlamydiaceae bacterium]|jgi:reactive intermediate/imine deaminase
MKMRIYFLCLAAFASVQAQNLKIIGGGLIGALESYHAYLDGIKNGTQTRIVVYEKGPSFSDLGRISSLKNASTNTTYNIFPSLTPDEILSVVPRGSELVEKLAILFNQPGGIRVDDVPGANDSAAAIRFKNAVELYGRDENHDDRTNSLLKLGKMSMDLWHRFYENADDELKAILEQANYNPCHDPSSTDKQLQDGYRIDLIYDVAGAAMRAEAMKNTYKQIGYAHCEVLSPGAVMVIDPSLTAFCLEHSESNGQELQWKNDSSALWRPGGCINTPIFLPKFYAYLKKIMGESFAMEFEREVTGVELDLDGVHITGLHFADGSRVEDALDTQYVFCPGESVGTLEKCGFEEPAYAGFAGPSLVLNIPLSPELVDKYKNFRHCMEVHKVGIVLAWQGRFRENTISLGVAGTKAFYGDQQPTIDQDFAQNRHLVQLNIVNDVVPDLVSLACGWDTRGVCLTSQDMFALESKGLLMRWVGRRAVAYDGFPTLGALYCKEKKLKNARCTTHLGSGGVSFSFAAVNMSRNAEDPHLDAFAQKILHYADSRRNPEIFYKNTEEDMTLKKIETDHAPKAIGPYSQAVSFGQFLFVSGQIPIHPQSGKIIEHAIEGQTRQVLQNIEAILDAAGLTWENVIKTEIYVKDIGDFQTINAIYSEKFPHAIKPARQLMQVAKLPLDSLIEISCIAIK